MKEKHRKEFTMVRDKDCVRLLNKLAFLCDDQIPTINSIKEINYAIITRILIAIFNRRGIYPNIGDEFLSQENQFARIVDFLASDILHISLDHIKPNDLIAHNPISLYNLLEILAACELYLPYDEQNQQQTSSLKDEALQIPAEAFQTLTLSHSPCPPSPSDHSPTWSSPTNSSLSHNTTFILSSSSSCLSLSSISSQIPDSPVVESPSPRLIKVSTEQLTNQLVHSSLNPSRRSSKSRQSSPDSACICCKLRDVGINTETPAESHSQLDKQSASTSNSFSEINFRRKIDKATSTEPEDSIIGHRHVDVKQSDQTFDTYEALASQRFALEIGHKLQRALKLEEATKQIEAKLCAITGELNTQSKRTNKASILKKKTFQPPWKNKPINQPMTRKTPTVASTKLNIYTKPLVCNDRIQKLLKSKLIQSTSPGRLKLDASGGQLLLDEWKRQSSALAEVQSALESRIMGCPSSQRLKRIRERSLIREARTERARVHRLISELERKTCSKYLSTQSKEQQLIKSQAEEKIKSFRYDLLNYKDMVKNQMDKEQEKRKRLLDAFTNYYQQQLSLIKDKLDQEESELTARYKHSNVSYNKLRRELKSNLEKEIGSLISSN